MLGKITTARFASNHSPTRERREALYAKSPPDPQRNNLEAGAERPNGGPSALGQRIAASRFAVREGALGASGERLREAAAARDVQAMASDIQLSAPPEMPAEQARELENLQGALHQLVLIDAELDDVNKTLQRETDPEWKQRVESRKQHLEEWKRVLIAQHGEKQAITERLLRSPQVLYRTIIGLEESQQRYEEAHSELLREAPELEQEFLRMLDAFDETSSDRSDEYRRFRQNIERQAPTFTLNYIRRKNEERAARGEQPLGAVERDAQLVRLAERLYLNLHADVHRGRQGAERIPTLRDQAASLKTTLDAQIRERAEQERLDYSHRLAEASIIPVGQAESWCNSAGIKGAERQRFVKAMSDVNGMEDILTHPERDPQLIGLINRAMLQIRRVSFVDIATTKLEPLLEDLGRYTRDPETESTLAKRGLRPAPPVQPQTERFSVRGGSTDDYMTYARGALQRLEGLKREDAPARLVAEARIEQQNADEWVRATALRVKALRTQPHPAWPVGALDRLGEIAATMTEFSGNKNPATPLKLIGADDETGRVINVRAATGRYLDMLENPQVLEMARQAEGTDGANRFSAREEEASAGRIREICDQTHMELEQVLGTIANVTYIKPRSSTYGVPEGQRVMKVLTLKPPLNHEICRSETLDLIGILNGRSAQMAQNLEAARAETEDPQRAMRAAQSEARQVQSLKKFHEHVAASAPPAGSVITGETLPEQVDAVYSRDSKRIKVNVPRYPELGQPPRFDALVKHETGHLILHALEESGVLPFLTKAIFETRKDMREDPTNESSPTFQQLFGALRETSPYYRLYKPDDTDAIMDELLNRHADCRRLFNQIQALSAGSERTEKEREYQRRFGDAAEQKLFAILDRNPFPQAKAGDDGSRGEALTDADGGKMSTYAKRFQEIDERLRRGGNTATGADRTSVRDDAPADRFNTHDDEGGGTAVSESSSAANMKQILEEIRRKIYKSRTFVEAYKSKYPEITSRLQVLGNEADETYAFIKKTFEHGAEREAYGAVPPEEDPAFVKEANAFNQHLDETMMKAIGKIDVASLDTSQEKQKPKRGWLDGVQFLSINDIIKLYNDTAEDIASIYKRRQDRKLKEVGGVITKALTKVNVPGLSNYTKGLNAYHERRYSGAETDAADKWKDGMKNLDTHEILHFLHATRNKDAVRGTISLLTERGEMDWNDADVWRTLNSLAGANYEMPIEPCLRDDVLRDTWLRKMISDIWNDKELYYHWRTHNDSQTDSGKKGFTQTADQLMNVAGGAENELAKQLRLKIANPHNPPEDVKPHLYEEILDYAIRNGKLTMEAKMYYIVRGVASGILSVDRLRTLAGENGGILNQFPFIDYFYKKNNSLAEVQAIAERLTERDGPMGPDTYKPGIKTTLWLHLEVAREESVQMRISKGTSRTGAENIDHEDVPFFVPQLDLEARRNMLNVISGSRQKMSPEALKNLYCGDSSSLKIAGMIARMEEKGQDRFTKFDARKYVQNLVCFIDFDNIVTRNGYDAESSRPVLGDYQLETFPPSSDGEHTVKDYRERMTELVREVMDKYATDIESDTQWADFRKGKNEKIPNPEPGGPAIEKPTEPEITLQHVVPQGSIRAHTPKIANKIFNSMPYFLRAFEQAVLRDPSRFKEVLKKYSDRLYNEGGSAGLNFKSVEKAYEEARKSGNVSAKAVGSSH